jgi:YidC/Oxa1 family membrane protein insertase
VHTTPDSYALFLGLAGYEKITPATVFEVMEDKTNTDGSREITLGWQDAQVRLEKHLLFAGPKTGYGVNIAYKIINRSAQVMHVTPLLENGIRQKPQTNPGGLFGRFHKPDDLYQLQYFHDDKLSLFRPEVIPGLDWHQAALERQLGGLKATEAGVSWLSVTDRYFLVGLIGDQTQAAQTQAHFGEFGDYFVTQLSAVPLTLNPGQIIEGHFAAYLGPKKLDDMRKMDVQLERSVDYGWFSILAMPILWLMNLLHQVISNWGLVIITLTFLIKLALSPINKKSLMHMKAMQQLQPKLAELKVRYGDDKEKINLETMQLFKTHKVNPASGCLPMLLQMPVYIVLYKVLWNAIEFYHAPFFGFYHDLSAPDPYFILPVLLGIFMFLQQKLTPNPSADPAQAKMMMFMPLMFAGMMFFLPVGLVVYIFINTMMSVVQQFMMKRDLTLKDFVTGQWEAKSV